MDELTERLLADPKDVPAREAFVERHGVRLLNLLMDRIEKDFFRVFGDSMYSPAALCDCVHCRSSYVAYRSWHAAGRPERSRAPLPEIDG